MQVTKAGQCVVRTVPHVVKGSEMSSELEEEVINKTYDALELFNSDIQVAKYLTRHFHEKYRNSVWHCIIGRKFSSNITHESKFYIYYYIGQKAFLLFKSS